jgi:Uma2 family endonuclease
MAGMIVYGFDMTAVRKVSVLTVEEYLQGEKEAMVRHEYVAGSVHAMSGASNQHNTIAVNALVEFGLKLRGKPCQPFNSDTKVRVNLPDQTRFYYPDVMVVCHANPPEDHFQEHPVLIVEVLSPSTRRIDQTEKKDAYLCLPSLQVLLLVESDRPAVTMFQRNAFGKFERVEYEGLEAVIPLKEIDGELPLAALYERVEFLAEEVGE